MDFSNKNVLITGGSRGIGLATAQTFARLGARVAINFNQDSKAAAEACDSLVGEGHFAIRADIAKPDAVEKMVAAVLGEMGAVHVLVNNAGIYIPHPIAESDYGAWQAAWHNTMATNLFGAANVTYCVARAMMKQGGGSIVNVSSRGAFRGEPLFPAYAASKAALNAMSQSLAQALGSEGISVSVVAPGFVDTDMAREILDSEAGEAIRQQSSMGRVATPQEVADGIVFLASERARFMTGAILDINGASYLRS